MRGSRLLPFTSEHLLTHLLEPEAEQVEGHALGSVATGRERRAMRALRPDLVKATYLGEGDRHPRAGASA